MDFPCPTYPPLPRHIAQHASLNPDRPALIDGDLVLNYAALDDRIRRGAEKLRRKGVRKGDRVIIVASAKTELMLGIFAAMAAGAGAAPLSAAEENIGSLVEYFEPALVLIGSNIPASALRDVRVRMLALSELAIDDPGEVAELGYDDIGLFILTSGTTGGQRRGAMISYRSLSGTAEYMNEVMGIQGDVRELITAPLEHAFGMGRIKATLHAGGTAILTPPLFSPKIIVGELSRHDCNMMSSVVSALGLVLDSEAAALSQFADRIRWMELGSGQFSPAAWRTLAGCLPRTRFFFNYGLTEARRSTFLEYNSAPEKIGTVGKPARWVRVRIVDDENRPLPPNQEGRIQVDGVNKASGYFKYPDAWRRKQNGEWLDTGDNGFLDEDGYLTYAGRIDDTINVGGLKVAPEEVEMELQALLNGRTYAVARIPDPLGIEGHVPALFIETKEENLLSIEQVRSHLEPRLPPFKIPRRIYSIEAIPRTATTRKIRRGALAEIALVQEKAKLPKTTALLAQLHARSRQHWPAVVGTENLSRLQLAALLGNEATKLRGASLPSCLEWLRKAVAENDFDLARLIKRCEELLSPSPNGSVAIGIGSDPSRIAEALQWRALMREGECLLLPPLARSHVAQDLGWIGRHRPSQVLVDKARFARLATAEAHLSDAFDFPEFRHLLITGPEPDAGDLLQFRRTFRFDPQHLSALGAVWSLRTLRPKQDSADVLQSEEIWRILRDTAAGIFHVDREALQLDSSSENTKGWNSLGYLQLVMAVEEAFGRNLAPRDIMAVRQLRDLVSILGNSPP